MDFELPPDAQMLRDMLQRFIQKEARPLEMKYFTAGELAPEERARLRKAVEQLGLWGLTVPETYGGGGLDMVTTCVLEEQLGGTFVPVEIGEVPPMLYACSGEQIARYLEPALTGSRRAILAAREPGRLRPAEWTTHAIPDRRGFVLNGQKALSFEPEPDDFLMVIARAEEGLTLFLLDATSPGLSLSLNGDRQATLNDCQIDASAMLGEPGGALALSPEAAPQAWIRMGARYIGLVERLIEMSAEHAKEWVSMGAALSVRPAIQRMLAEMRVEVESARWLVYHAAWLADNDQGGALRVPAAQVRLATGEMLQRAVDRATMIYAGPGPSAPVEPQRMVRSIVPPEALQVALENARAIVAADVLGLLQS